MWRELMPFRMDVKLMRSGVGDAAVAVEPGYIGFRRMGVRQGQNHPVPRHEERGRHKQRKPAPPHHAYHHPSPVSCQISVPARRLPRTERPQDPGDPDSPRRALD